VTDCNHLTVHRYNYDRYLTVHMTRFGHLTLVLTVFIIVQHVILVLFQYFIFLLSHLQFIIMYTLFICTSIPSFSYTLIRSLSDNLEFARPNIGCFIFFDRVFDETGHVARSWIPFYYFWYSFFFFIQIIPDSLYIAFSCYIFFISYNIMCRHYMHCCSDIDLSF